MGSEMCIRDSLNDELTALRSRGARIALDDTGAGYSGLRHVTLMRPEIIKIDRALVENLHDDPGKLALIDSFATFAHRTGAQSEIGPRRCPSRVDRRDRQASVAEAAQQLRRTS